MMTEQGVVLSETELADMLKCKSGKKNNDSFQVVTEAMIKMYPGFAHILAEEILTQLSENSRSNADYVIGVSGHAMYIVQPVVRLINQWRRMQGKKSCAMLSWAFMDARHVSLSRMLKTFFRNVVGMRKKILFVHCLFDYPFDYPVGRYDDAVALERWIASEATQDEKAIKELAESMGGKFCQAIILSVPRVQYAKFLAEIN